MRRQFIFAAGSLLVLSSLASAESLTEKTGVNSALGVSPSTADFVQQAAVSDMFEIKSSELAQQKGIASLQTFAQRMITDHTVVSGQLKSLVHDGKVSARIPAALDSSHQQMLDKLKGLSGDDFAERYSKDQVAGHKDAVDLFERYAKGGENQTLKNWAATTLPKLREHLTMAEGLRDNEGRSATGK
jgi:putative membrane protein